MRRQPHIIKLFTKTGFHDSALWFGVLALGANVAAGNGAQAVRVSFELVFMRFFCLDQKVQVFSFPTPPAPDVPKESMGPMP